MSEDIGLGYRPDLEDVAHLEATQRTLDTSTLFAASHDGPIDEKVRERAKAEVKIESQARTNSCTGHGAGYADELDEFLETGVWTQRSRWGTYILAQKESGITGDHGAYIDAVARAGKKYGFGHESLWPFTGVYHTSPKSGMDAYLADAAKRRLASWKILKSYADMALWSQTGQGGIVVGFPWYENWQRIGTNGVVPTPNGVLKGYHCMAIHWLTKFTEGSRNYFEGPNSHGVQYGDKGWMLWKPTLLDWIFKQRNVLVVGFSGMRQEDAVARPLNYLTSSSFLK